MRRGVEKRWCTAERKKEAIKRELKIGPDGILITQEVEKILARLNWEVVGKNCRPLIEIRFVEGGNIWGNWWNSLLLVLWVKIHWDAKTIFQLVICTLLKVGRNKLRNQSIKGLKRSSCSYYPECPTLWKQHKWLRFITVVSQQLDFNDNVINNIQWWTRWSHLIQELGTGET